jgi:hypothetical protein
VEWLFNFKYEWMITFGEHERGRKKAVVACFKILFLEFAWRDWENHKKTHSVKPQLRL